MRRLSQILLPRVELTPYRQRQRENEHSSDCRSSAPGTTETRDATGALPVKRATIHDSTSSSVGDVRPLEPSPLWRSRATTFTSVTRISTASMHTRLAVQRTRTRLDALS